MAKVNQTYYVPDQSRWPIIGAVALFFLAFGAGHLVNEVASGQTGFGRYLMMAGVALLAFMLFGWFRHIIRESMTGLYSAQMDRSFRQGMVWFIFSEVMFFLAFFGVLFYARQLAVPWLDGAGHRVMTGQLLWPDFTAHWPLLKTPEHGKIEVGTKRREPLAATTTTPGLLILGNAGIARHQITQSIQKILVRRVNHWQYGNVSSYLTADHLFVQ
mgnify:CR=1 FL=1